MMRDTIIWLKASMNLMDAGEFMETLGEENVSVDGIARKDLLHCWSCDANMNYADEFQNKQAISFKDSEM